MFTEHCSGQSGDYHCKAATFTHEETSTHTLTVFGENKIQIQISKQIQIQVIKTTLKI